MEAKKVVLMPEQVVPAVEALELKLNANEARLLAFGLRHANMGRRELAESMPGFRPFNCDTQDALIEMVNNIDRAFPRDIKLDATRYGNWPAKWEGKTQPPSQGRPAPVAAIVEFPTEFHALLQHIVKVINLGDNNSRDLWNVLTALRGPDNELQNIKESTTAVIRHKIGLSRNSLGIDVFPDCEGAMNNRNTMTKYTHFRIHVEQAFRVLGLVWDKVNK